MNYSIQLIASQVQRDCINHICSSWLHGWLARNKNKEATEEREREKNNQSILQPRLEIASSSYRFKSDVNIIFSFPAKNSEPRVSRQCLESWSGQGADSGGGGGNRAKSITFKRCLNIYLTPVAAERMRDREKERNTSFLAAERPRSERNNFLAVYSCTTREYCTRCDTQLFQLQRVSVGGGGMVEDCFCAIWSLRVS